jgi:hypothetical protein
MALPAVRGARVADFSKAKKPWNLERHISRNYVRVGYSRMPLDLCGIGGSLVSRHRGPRRTLYAQNSCGFMGFPRVPTSVSCTRAWLAL